MFELLSLIPFYLIGSFPTGKLVARSKGVTIEEHGSGNVGATNVARVLGKKAGVITLVGDISKGLLGVAFASLLFEPHLVSYAALALVLGHCFSLPGMKGGKGVATALGVLLGLRFWLGLFAALSFAATFKTTRYVSVSSVTAALLIPVLALLTELPDHLVFSLAAISLVIVLRHRPNIKRLIEGREPKFGEKSSSTVA